MGGEISAPVMPASVMPVRPGSFNVGLVVQVLCDQPELVLRHP
jgi:hypothetical protein